MDSLIKKRVDFICDHQQMKESNTRKDAFMVYDNEKNEIYLNNTRNCNPVDRDEVPNVSEWEFCWLNIISYILMII